MTYTLFSFNHKEKHVTHSETGLSLHALKLTGRAYSVPSRNRMYIFHARLKVWSKYNHKAPIDKSIGDRWKVIPPEAVPGELKVHMLLQAV